MNSVWWPRSPWVIVAQWIEPPPCVREVMGSIPVGYSDFFLCPTLVSCWLFYLCHRLSLLWKNLEIELRVFTNFLSRAAFINPFFVTFSHCMYLFYLPITTCDLNNANCCFLRGPLRWFTVVTKNELHRNCWPRQRFYINTEKHNGHPNKKQLSVH